MCAWPSFYSPQKVMHALSVDQSRTSGMHSVSVSGYSEDQIRTERTLAWLASWVARPASSSTAGGTSTPPSARRSGASSCLRGSVQPQVWGGSDGACIS